MNMKKNIFLSALALIIITACCVFFVLKGKRYEVVVTQDRLKEKLAEKFPYTENESIVITLGI